MNPSLPAALQLLQRHASSSTDDLHIHADATGVEVDMLAARLRFHHSFISGPVATRAAQSAQLLLKACNNKQRNIDKILDVTAGWGVDSYILARHGHQVTMLEQNQLVYAIVACSLELLAADAAAGVTASRMNIENTDANRYLNGLADDREYDCIYLDPMFRAHKSGAKPAKEMQILQAITANVDIDDCFQAALLKAGKRVVVKRAAKAPPLSQLKPDLVYRARSIRFDIYLTT
ncbi:MAG: class I SAM-dependent methyltransferase [Gammaproteobacteria bacterium]|nr:class I SAM-dependent methyltransferase [Gammaproteobacteria bacterium]